MQTYKRCQKAVIHILVTYSYSLDAPFCIYMTTDIQAFWKVSTLEPVFLSLLVVH